jgi:hypothetical protein
MNQAVLISQIPNYTNQGNASLEVGLISHFGVVIYGHSPDRPRLLV